MKSEINIRDINKLTVSDRKSIYIEYRNGNRAVYKVDDAVQVLLTFKQKLDNAKD